MLTLIKFEVLTQTFIFSLHEACGSIFRKERVIKKKKKRGMCKWEINVLAKFQHMVYLKKEEKGTPEPIVHR